MAESIFADKAYVPTAEEMAAAVKTMRKEWDALADYTLTTFGATAAPHFYGPKYGWCLRFMQGKKMLLLLYPLDKGFRVCVNLSPAAVDQALAELPLGKKIRTALENAPTYPEGRPIYVEMSTQKDIKDIRALLLLKGKPKKQAV